MSLPIHKATPAITFAGCSPRLRTGSAVQSQAGEKKGMRTFLTFAFGLLPFYAAVIVLFAASDGSSQYWSVAPWMVIASVPACAVTFLIAGLAGTVHDHTAGSGRRKTAFAALTVAAGIAAIAAVVGNYYWTQRESGLRARDEALATTFTWHHPGVLAVVGGTWAKGELSGTSPGRHPEIYRIFVRGEKKSAYAIVRIDRSAQPKPRFELLCMTSSATALDCRP